ncbi:hypothetical protein ACFE04_028006 [Oxalis oulophora]
MATNQFSFMNINILVVDDDSTSLAIVSAMLKIWKHQVVTSNTPMDALSTLRGQGGIDLVVTDLHMPEMNGFELQEIIQLEFNVPVVIMSSDDKENVILESMARGAALYLPKPVKPNDLKNIWQYALKGKKLKLTAILGPIGGGSDVNQERGGSITGGNEKLSSDEVLKSGSSSSINVEMRGSKKRKPYERRIKEIDLEFDDHTNIDIAPKKTKIVWTGSLHIKFVQAMNELGFKKAVPKRILEVMNVPGLTRENVASHLQKYRLYLKSSTNKLDSSKGMNGRALKSNFVVGRDSLLFGTPNRAQYPIHATNLPPTFSFIQQRYPNIMNQNSTNKHAPGLRSYNQSNLFTNNPLLFGSSRQSLVCENTNNSLFYQQNPKSFGTNLSVSNHSGVTFGGMSSKANSMPIYQQDKTQHQVTGPLGIIGYSSNCDVDETTGGNVHSTNVNNNYRTSISTGFTNDINNYVVAQNVNNCVVAGNMMSNGIRQFQFNNGNAPSYGGYVMSGNNNCNGNNVNFVAPGGYNMIQGGHSFGIWNGNVNNSSGLENVVQQPPQLPTIMPQQFGHTYEPPAVDHNKVLYDSISQEPNETQLGVDHVTNIEQVLVDPYERTLNRHSEMEIPNPTIENFNMGGGGGGGDEENIIDSIFRDVPLTFDDNYPKYDQISNFQKESIEGDIFDFEVNNHHASDNQPSNNTQFQNWTDEDLAAFTDWE